MKSPRSSWLSLFPGLTIAIFLSSIIIGLFSTWLPAFGYLPVIGSNELTLNPWFDLMNHPGTVSALRATLISGWGSVFLVMVVTFLLFAVSYNTRFWMLLQNSLAPLLAVPHAAFAIGFLFLIAPSGWLLRLVSPEITGFTVPPDLNIVKDRYGISLALALVIKEVPFLVLMTLSALGRVDVPRSIAIGKSLGYDSGQVWIKVIVPQLYPKIRLSIYAILAYSLSVVDIAQILGPTIPPTLAVQTFRWFNDPDLVSRLLGAAGATLVLLLVISSIGGLYLLERVLNRLSKPWLTSGSRDSRLMFTKPFSSLLILVIVLSSLLSVVVLVIWSFTWRWRFPAALPNTWSLRFWLKGLDTMVVPALNTVSAGVAAAVMAIVIVIGCLENEVSLSERGKTANLDRIIWLVYLPLLIPQIAFIFGVQLTLVSLNLDGLWISLVWSHLLFVLPYVFLTLGPIYRAYDRRISDVALSLCGSRWKVFFKVKLPILLRPIIFSLAIGFSVSVAQYLPTLFVGAGRFDTITTEAVALAGGSDRRIVAVYALCQLLAPLVVFTAVLVIPRVLYRNRKEMQLLN